MSDNNKITEAAKRIMQDSRFREAKKDNDTVRLWENYREQALLWRAIALLEIPATIISLIFAIIIWQGRSITLDVPANPEPGMYQVGELSDAQFLTVGEKFINLIATYQPYVAEKQFITAAEMLVEPVLNIFETDVLGKDLDAIKQTNKAQVYYIDPTQTSLERSEEDDLVIMRVVGERYRTISGNQLEPDVVQYAITMKTIPAAVKHNQYGIVIVNIEQTSIESDSRRKNEWE